MCCNLSEGILNQYSKFVGCDGKEWDDSFLIMHLKKAVSDENYEWANECAVELEDRGLNVGNIMNEKEILI